MFSDLLAVVFLPTHMLNKAFAAFWKEWGKAKMHLLYVLDQARTYCPVHILRCIQLELYYWFDSIHRKSTPRDLDFSRILYEIHINAFSPPLLPPHLMMSLEPPTAVGGMLMFPSALTTASASSELSANAEQAKAAAKSVLVPNPAGLDATLEQHLQGLHIWDVTQNGSVSNNDKGHPMCVAFHAKGCCFSKCECAADHKPHSTAEHNKLRNWVQSTAAKVKAGKASF